MRVVLASASPRRRELLARVVHPYDIVPADIDETHRPDEDPEAYVRRMAEEKACRVSGANPDAWVVGSDTTVVLGTEVLGKPTDPEDAVRMLSKLSAHTHEVLTGVTWARGGAAVASGMTRSKVSFRRLGEEQIREYVATGEPLDKAGSYGIQGAGEAFIERVEGSVTGVIGLPIEETARLAAEAGVPGRDTALTPDAVPLRLGAVIRELTALTVARGRPPGSVRLLTVSKGHVPEMAAAAIDAGATDLGENYVQEALAKQDVLGVAAQRVRWHLIGPLQRNKAARAAERFDLIHTIDRPEIAAALVKRAPGPVRGLLQVNAAEDPAKAGIAPASVGEVTRELAGLDGFALDGLMTIGAADASTAGNRATFTRLRECLEDVRSAGFPEAAELSMGMSGDYDAAIECGATLVRLGTAIFGPRPPRPK